MQGVSSHAVKAEGTGRGPLEDKDFREGSDHEQDADGELDLKNGNSSNDEGGPNRKRRRSRKGLDKKFECPWDGCGKSYSRAEHL
jgi:hypothetical protein